MDDGTGIYLTTIFEKLLTDPVPPILCFAVGNKPVTPSPKVCIWKVFNLALHSRAIRNELRHSPSKLYWGKRKVECEM